MNIQILTYLGNEKQYKAEGIRLSKLSEPDSFDCYDINVINLNDENIWRYKGSKTDKCNISTDLSNLGVIIKRTKKSKCIVVMPQNHEFLYYESSYGGYNYHEELKNIPTNVAGILADLASAFRYINLIYEPTLTKIGNNNCEGVFYFDNDSSNTVLTQSIKSDKTTTIERDGIIFTSLNFTNAASIIEFVDYIGLMNADEEAVPEWLNEVELFDDKQQKMAIVNSEAIIKEQQNVIESAEKVLEQNNHFKSILYTQSQELVEVVFEILEDMLGFDLSNFKDEHKEDFLYETEELSYIGEIKGVNTNVRSEHVSQLDVHYQGYLDNNSDKADCTKAWLIMNHQRKTPVKDRKEIHDTQVNLAKRNGSLIIDTYTLLKMYERYKSDEFSREQCLNYMCTETGVLHWEDIL